MHKKLQEKAASAKISPSCLMSRKGPREGRTCHTKAQEKEEHVTQRPKRRKNMSRKGPRDGRTCHTKAQEKEEHVTQRPKRRKNMPQKPETRKGGEKTQLTKQSAC